MPTLSIETIESERVTFVEAVIETDRPHRLRLEADFDGPIWPPRTDGTIRQAWEENELEIDVDAGGTALGFATPVQAKAVAIEITHSEPRARLPEGIGAWIERMKARVELAEPLDADDIRAGTDAVASVGGLSNVETLAAEIARDRRLANRLSVVPDDLCMRLEAIEIPTSAYARIARETGQKR